MLFRSISTNGLRLVDLDPYVVNGQTLYSYVGIKNQGVDAKSWWWYPNVSFQTVVDKVNQNGARLLKLKLHDNGNFSAIMVKNDGKA